MKQILDKGVSLLLAAVLAIVPVEMSITPAYAFSEEFFQKKEDFSEKDNLIENNQDTVATVNANLEIYEIFSLTEKVIIKLEFGVDGKVVSSVYEVLTPTETQEQLELEKEKEEAIIEQEIIEEPIETEEDYTNTQTIEEEVVVVATADCASADTTTTNALYSGATFKNMGVIYWGAYRWTWYSQRVLSGGGLSIPGRTVDDQGYVVDENDYICLASSDLAKGTVIETPFGKLGKIYDCGCASGTIDVYTNW